ncbi:hypothetical protein WJX74_002425 [Apatococcus lobatus]|uniref:Uncharacterized protein n=1 Tax=Apatococcus lobatus TaxID=904363 RepID=A0AAW1RP57_9CHLO
MAKALAHAANEAFVEDDFERALELYGQAIAAADSAQAAELYAARAQTHLKLENFLEASGDAQKATDLDPKLGKAYLRRGIACFNLDEFEAAKAAFEAGQALEPSKTTYKTWIRKCNAELEDEMESFSADPVGATTSAAPASNAKPTTSAPSASPEVTPQREGDMQGSAIPMPAGAGPSAPYLAPAAAASEPALAPAAAPAQPLKYRYQWFQSSQSIELTVYAKGLTAERVDVTFGPQELQIVIRNPHGVQEFEMKEQLFGRIDPQASRYDIRATQLALKLKKTDPAHWTTLEKSSQPAPAAPSADQVASADTSRPAYPSSMAKRQPVEWDKLAAEVKKEEEDEKPDGEAGLQKLFRSIYGNADEDTRRAMNKSFQESNGTVLSTNWKEIGAKKTDFQPPKGMEAHKYEM